MSETTNLEKLKLPWTFLENQGQEDTSVFFTTELQGGKTFFCSDKMWFVLLESVDIPRDFNEIPDFLNSQRNGVALELSCVNANANVIPQGQTEREGRTHHVLGNNSNNWINNTKSYQELYYTNLWDDIDLNIARHENSLKMNWIVNDASKVNTIQLIWAGANNMAIDVDGNLVITHSLGTLTDYAPIAYQEINGEKVSIECAFRIDDTFTFGFDITGTYDVNYPIIIDPIIGYSSFLGLSATNESYGIAIDLSKCPYITGYTNSTDFPTTPGAFQTTNGSSYSAFITKFSQDGSSLVYSTYLGGTNSTYARSIAVDSQNNAYITGYTMASDFPTTVGAFQTTLAGYLCGFVTKLSADGSSLEYSTYLGGDTSSIGGLIQNIGYGITVDSNFNAYACGSTMANNFPTTPDAFQTVPQDTVNAYITKLSTDGTSLVYSTYLGGDNQTIPFTITVDSENNAYVAGETQATDFPVSPTAFQTETQTSSFTGFITKFDENGENIIYSTYLGGSNFSVISSITLNNKNQAYVTGQTYSNDFPVTPDAYQTVYGNRSTFITILSEDGSDLIASTYLGAPPTRSINVLQIMPSGESGYGIAVDAAGIVYVTGATYSANFPTTPDIIPSSYGGNGDAFISVLSANLSTLMVSFFLGGTSYDEARGIALIAPGSVYVAGDTYSANFPTTENAYQQDFGSNNRACFLVRADFPFVYVSKASMNLFKIADLPPDV